MKKWTLIVGIVFVELVVFAVAGSFSCSFFTSLSDAPLCQLPAPQLSPYDDSLQDKGFLAAIPIPAILNIYFTLTALLVVSVFVYFLVSKFEKEQRKHP